MSPTARAVVSHNRVDPSPYYPVSERRMVMNGYARRQIPRLSRRQLPVRRSRSGPADGGEARADGGARCRDGPPAGLPGRSPYIPQR